MAQSRSLPEDQLADIDTIIGVDLAQGGADFTALAVVERHCDPTWDAPKVYYVTHLERWRDARTARVPERLTAICRQLIVVSAQRDLERYYRVPATLPPIEIIVDVTGVGPFGLDPLRAAGFEPEGVTIHGGDAVSRAEDGRYRVPKRDIAGVLNTTLQGRRLHIAPALPEARILHAELSNFKVRININTGHDSYEAGTGDSLWREGEHDDLVLAVGLAIWYGERAGTAADWAATVEAFRAGGYPA